MKTDLSKLSDAEVVDAARKAKAIAEKQERSASPSRWKEADCYADLARRGWTQRKIAEECGTNQATVSKFICLALDYSVLNNRPPFWGAFQKLNSEKDEDASIVHVTHNSGNDEWCTPLEFANAARRVMGIIDCDPASSKIANKIIKAKTYFTPEDDGLKQTWGKRVFMNPPYSQSLCCQFTHVLILKYNSGEVKEACVLVNNATDTTWFQEMLTKASCVCFPAGRIKFLDSKGHAGGAPLQGQAILYFGSNSAKFKKEFSEFGKVLA